ncbi:MAG: HNH endonuclease, partial [Longimicrobiales bacterium]
MNAYVGVTDRDWFDFLSNQERVDEVNFWQPNRWGGQFGVLRRGEPFLFKLKAPVNAIAGGGFFERYHDLPLSLAWDSFGIKNGAASRQTVWERIARLRRERPAWYEDFTIGCIILVEPYFWPEELWIPQPADFSPNIVRGRRYELGSGAGAALWREVVTRLDAIRAIANDERDRLIAGGFGEPELARRRIGQGTFRVAVTEAYQRQCAITRERALPALEAAHIRPFAETEKHYVKHGLLLRSDVHRLFDAGYLTVTPEYRVEASPRMRDDFNDGESYLQLHGSGIWVPGDTGLKPDPQ